jgi:hypothetical protein
VASLGETFVTKSYDKKGNAMYGKKAAGMKKGMAAKKMADMKKKTAAKKKSGSKPKNAFKGKVKF